MKMCSLRMPSASCLLTCAAVLSYIIPANALYFYMDAHSPKCFYEELPSKTLVVGHYNAEQWNEATNSYASHPDLSITITVDEIFDNDHRVVNQKGSSKDGKFVFTAADSGDHKICFTPTGSSLGSGWLGGGGPQGAGIKFTLDMAIGEGDDLENPDKEHMDDIVSRVRDLNRRLTDIRREQVHQREREAEFRNMSELTNSRVVRWSLIQLAVLAITCAWQLSHLRAFFIKQKLT